VFTDNVASTEVTKLVEKGLAVPSYHDFSRSLLAKICPFVMAVWAFEEIALQ